MLQDLQDKKNHIDTGIKSGDYTPAEMFQKNRELESIVDKI
jgi:hypothetical protein